MRVNSENHDQMQHSAMLNLGLHCLLRHICPSAWDKYGIKCDFSSKELQKKKKNLWKIHLFVTRRILLPVCLQRVNKNSVINIHALQHGSLSFVLFQGKCFTLSYLLYTSSLIWNLLFLFVSILYFFHLLMCLYPWFWCECWFFFPKP